MLKLYNILLWIIIIIAFPVILLLVLFSEKRRKTVLHRLTLSSHFSLLTSHLSQPPIWIHALSVGEVLSAIPIVRALKDSVGKIPRMFSASTHSGFETAVTMLNQDADGIFYFPYDLSLCVRRAVRYINPASVIIVETDIWPNFLFHLKKQNIPAMLVNARLSEKSFSGYRRWLFLTKAIFGTFSRICCQSKADAERFEALGVLSDRIHITGNVKFDQAEISFSDNDILYLQSMINPSYSRKVIVAGSTHDGEEKILAKVFSKLQEEFDNLVLVIVPRDPKRSRNICRLFNTAVLFSELEKTKSPVSDVIVIDRIGILRKLYAIAGISFVGGSMVRCGGHNPLEPAVFAKPVIFGSDMSDFNEIAMMLLHGGGAIQVRDADSFCHILYGLLKQRHLADKMGKAAYDVFSRNKGAVKRTTDIVASFINPNQAKG